MLMESAKKKNTIQQKQTNNLKIPVGNSKKRDVYLTVLQQFLADPLQPKKTFQIDLSKR